MITALYRQWIAVVFSVGAAACGGGAASESDPNHWSPLSRGDGGAAPAPGDGAVVASPACFIEPPVDDTIVISTPGAISHAPGRPCLEGCHEAGGVALSTFAVGGTVFRSKSRIVAERGFVQNVWGTRLEVDACGNIYAKESELRTKTATPPSVTEPTYRQMSKPLRGVKNPGSCNQSGCHDFSGPLRWGIYF